MAATDKSIYEKFIIESADQSRTVDISAGVIAFTLYAKAQKYLGASITGFTLYLYTIYAAIYGIIFFGEQLQNFHYLGASLVLIGVYFAKKT